MQLKHTYTEPPCSKPPWHLSSYHTIFQTWSDEDLIRRPSNSQRKSLQTELLPPVAFSPPTKWFVQTLKGVPKCMTLQWLSTLNNEQIFVKEIRPSVGKTDQSELQAINRNMVGVVFL